jgi:2,4-dienoyl-CoA reductase (NADPH2)
MIFKELRINKVTFPNRVLRSSMGGKMANYDGSVTSVWKNFEKRFAKGGVGGVISTTFSVNHFRHSPLEYPALSHNRFVPPLREFVKEIREAGAKKTGSLCPYIIQIGDPGYATQTSLLKERQDSRSSSSGFDFAYGYGNRRTAMKPEEIKDAIQDFADAAARVQDIGADGVEVTASKGYLIHQFLNPGLNRRRDEWGSGGDEPKRFLFLRRIVEEIRKRVGRDFLFGVKMSTRDCNYLPWVSFRLPPVWNLKHQFLGNTQTETLQFARELEKLGVDYLHLVSGFGFLSPLDTPGPLPTPEVRAFFNSTSHLSLKAKTRSVVSNVSAGWLDWLWGLGWKPELPLGGSSLGWRWAGLNRKDAHLFKNQVRMPIILNGGIKRKDLIEELLSKEQCDMVSIARGLLAHPDLVEQFRGPVNEPDNSCTYCNRCAGRTPTSPLGCYNVERFQGKPGKMQRQILKLNKPD